jgi:hypothetical protein
MSKKLSSWKLLALAHEHKPRGALAETPARPRGIYISPRCGTAAQLGKASGISHLFTIPPALYATRSKSGWAYITRWKKVRNKEEISKKKKQKKKKKKKKKKARGRRTKESYSGRRFLLLFSCITWDDMRHEEGAASWVNKRRCNVIHHLSPLSPYINTVEKHQVAIQGDSSWHFIDTAMDRGTTSD